MKDILTFQPKETTNWEFDTVVLYRKYVSPELARQDRVNLVRSGWMVDTAYPHDRKDGTWETFAVIQCS